MKTFARLATLGLLCIAASAVNACSSDDDDAKAPGTTPAAAFPDAKSLAKGEYYSELEACQKITAAYQKVLDAGSCSYSGAALKCPDYLRLGLVGDKAALICGDYDKGPVDYCVDTYVPKLTCAQLTNNPCVNLIRPDPAAAASKSCDAAGGAGGAGGAAGSSAGGAAGSSAGGAAGSDAGGSGGATGGSAGAAAGSAGASAGGSAGASAGGSAGAAAGSAGASAGGSAGAAAGSAGADAGGSAGAAAGSAGASGADAGGSAGAGGSDAAGAGGAAAGSAGAGS